jgi:hypothetical protein
MGHNQNKFFDMDQAFRQLCNKLTTHWDCEPLAGFKSFSRFRATIAVKARSDRIQ